MSQRQFELDFEGGLVDRFPEWDEVIRHSVATCGRQQRAIAADVDMSPSELSRKLARRVPERPDEPSYPLRQLPELLAATKQFDPIYWLIERFLDDPERRKRAAISQIPALIDKLQQIVRDAAP